MIVTRDEAILALKKGEISLFIEKAPGADSIRYWFDPRSGEAQMTYLVLERSLRARAGPGDERSDVAPLRIQGTRYIDFLVPGLLAMDVMSSALWGIGWALIEIRIKKLLRRMAATPMHKSMFLASHFVTRLIVNAIEFFALFIFVYFYFGVKIQGACRRSSRYSSRATWRSRGSRSSCRRARRIRASETASSTRSPFP